MHFTLLRNLLTHTSDTLSDLRGFEVVKMAVARVAAAAAAAVRPHSGHVSRCRW